MNHVSQIFNIKNTTAYLEFIADELAEEAMTYVGWEETLDKDWGLTNYFIHSGDLQYVIDHPLTDVEVTEFSSGVPSIERVDYNGTTVSLSGNFSIEVEVSIEQFGAPTVEGTVTVEGLINVQFEFVDVDDEDIKMDSVKVNISGLDVKKFVEAYDDDYDDSPY